MDHDFPRTQFELPIGQTPTLSQNDSNDDEVQYMGTTIPPQPNGQQFNLGAEMPLVLSPPLSPPDIQGVPDSIMPTVTSLLSYNYNSPSGYIMVIPCFLCKQPFNNIEQLRRHLNIHAHEITHTNPATIPLTAPSAPPTTTVEHNSAWQCTPMTAPACDSPVPIAPVPVVTAPIYTPPLENSNENPIYSCSYCSKMFTYWAAFDAHQSHCRPLKNNNKTNNDISNDIQHRKPFKCNFCAKRYVRNSFCQRHVQRKHGKEQTLSPATPARPATPPRPVTPPRVITPQTPPASEDIKPREYKVYTTKLLNAIAAANYNPAKESAAKYLPPTIGGKQGLNSCIQVPPKQKYPMRSPYFNPNLWNLNANYA